jgi:hypothetical protein
MDIWLTVREAIIFSRRALIGGVTHDQMNAVLKFSAICRPVHVDTLGSLGHKLIRPMFPR